MKRVISIFPIMLVIVLLAALTVYADTPIKYSISDWHIHAIVNLDGSMEVKEYITYEISQEHEGLVRRDIDISEKIAIFRPKKSTEIYAERSLLLKQLGLIKNKSHE